LGFDPQGGARRGCKNDIFAAPGAAGFWSIDAWMGPEPLVVLRDAVDNGDIEAAREAIVGTMFRRGTRALSRDGAWQDSNERTEDLVHNLIMESKHAGRTRKKNGR